MKRHAADDDGGGSGVERRDHGRAPDAKRRRQDERGSASSVRLLSEAKEEDAHRLAQRQKQIDYGKNTVGYDRYCAAVPRHQRRRGVHPITPDKTLSVSKKAFDGMVRKWRQALHTFDPPKLQTPQADATAAAASASAAAASPRSSHNDDVADLDPARSASSHFSAAAGGAPSAPALSIYDNFVEGDGDAHDGGDSDDDDDDLL
ncbi:hypothetical protein PybrP1_004441 [[Pythium] brassicae (nom. inval.)]|nr:hypothetical protein PybrP1_004441 [[Pythium] brassicae (nom. inval.)]